MPAHSVACGQGDCLLRTPGPGRIELRAHLMRCPTFANGVDPFPLGFHLVTSYEQRGISFDEIEKQPFIGDVAPLASECTGERQIKWYFTQANAVAIEPGLLRHYQETDIFLRLQ